VHALAGWMTGGMNERRGGIISIWSTCGRMNSTIRLIQVASASCVGRLYNYFIVTLNVQRIKRSLITMNTCREKVFETLEDTKNRMYAVFEVCSF